jgi:hypothetical protein
MNTHTQTLLNNFIYEITRRIDVVCDRFWIFII